MGWAVAYALKSYQERKESRVQQGSEWSFVKSSGQIDTNRVFSPSFIYNQINGGRDLGSNFGDAFYVLATQGAAPMSAMPYTGRPFAPIPASARSAALPYRIDSFRTLIPTNTDELKTQLVAGFPIVIGVKVYRELVQLAPGAIWQSASERLQGNHAMVVVGYDDTRQAFKVINSWGSEWASNGYGWISYNVFRRVVNEAYIVVDFKGTQAETNTVVDVWTPPTVSAENSSITVDIANSNPNYFEPLLGGAIGLRLTGTISVPPGVSGTAQVVIPLRLQTNGRAVASLSPNYMLPSGQVAFGTPQIQLNGNGVSQLRWYAFVAYCALGVPKTKLCIPWPSPPFISAIQTDLTAEPILFIDNFGVAKGQPVNFFVRL